MCYVYHYTTWQLCGSYGNRTHSNRSTICDVSRYTNEPCNLSLFRRNYKNENLVSSPVRRKDQMMWTARESNPAQQHCKCFSPALEHGSPSYCIGDRIRTCSLFIPGEVSGQSECSYSLKELCWKSIPAASHGDCLFPPSAPNFLSQRKLGRVKNCWAFLPGIISFILFPFCTHQLCHKMNGQYHQ